ncbi:hypothetical protein ACFL6H_03755 [Candidatus Latescibacterota bacterium]
MNEKTIHFISFAGTVFLGLFLLSWFMIANPVKDFIVLIPGMDNRPATMSGSGEVVNIGAIYAAFDGIPSDILGSWPRFRGADFNNISVEETKLADNWGEAGPDLVWSVELGEGHAGPVVANGCVYIMDYDEEARSDLLRCFSFNDGREIWRRGYDVYVKRNHGMSRTVPAVTE